MYFINNYNHVPMNNDTPLRNEQISADVSGALPSLAQVNQCVELGISVIKRHKKSLQQASL